MYNAIEAMSLNVSNNRYRVSTLLEMQMIISELDVLVGFHEHVEINLAILSRVRIVQKPQI